MYWQKQVQEALQNVAFASNCSVYRLCTFIIQTQMLLYSTAYASVKHSTSLPVVL